MSVEFHRWWNYFLRDVEGLAGKVVLEYSLILEYFGCLWLYDNLS